MSEYLDHPRVHIDHAKGCWLYDSEGNRYLDGNASLWTNLHGHADEDLDRALREQLDRVAHATMLGLNHPVGARLSRKLAGLAPGDLSRVFFSDNGSNAVEIALKLSFQYWQLSGQPRKAEVVAMQHAYHGDTFGAMSVGDCGDFQARFGRWCFPVHRFSAPICKEYGGEVFAQSDGESLRALEELLAEHGPRIACVILEPWIQGAAGMLLQPRGFLRRLAGLTRKYGVHLILDEVFSAFGRAGPLLVCSEEGVCPDFLCLAKGLTGGYLPLAATTVREEIYEAFLGPFEELRTFFHGHTYTGNPLAAAVALKSLEKVEEHLRSGRLAKTTDIFEAQLRQHLAGHPNVIEIRQRGLAAGLDLYPGGDAERRFPAAHRVGMQVCLEARRFGLILRPLGDSLLLVPPITINREEIRHLFQATASAIDETMRKYEPIA